MRHGHKRPFYDDPLSDDGLRAVLDRFVADSDAAALAARDPVELVRLYTHPHDQEVAGLIVASLAYGRVASIKRSAGGLLERLGASPARSVDTGRAAKVADGFVYRFQRGSDLPRFLRALQRVRARHGSLAEAFAHGVRADEDDYVPAMDRFSSLLHGELGPRPSYGLRYLVPRAVASGGAAKRLCLYLRWMIRPAGPQDLGAWQRLAPGQVDPARLVVPLDTHIERIARYIGLTERRTPNMRTAREITAALRRLRPDDPLYYDIALCHLGISGSCPRARNPELCRGCPIRAACRLGPRPSGWRRSGGSPSSRGR